MATETTGAESGAGMPQLDFATFPNQIFWLAIALVAIYFILTRIALPRISAVLNDRASTITNDLAAAEELKLKAQEAEAAYTKALADARAEAQSIAAETKAEIQAQLDAELAKADAEISAKAAEAEQALNAIKENAKASVTEVANSTAAEIVAAMGGKADAKTVAAAVSNQLKG